jgi:type VI secretion system protein ImpA
VRHLRLPPEDLMRQPIRPDAPTGIDSRLVDSAQTTYRALRDARSVARREERRRETADAGQGGPELCAEWMTVRELAQKILTQESKDTEVLVWLVEAETRIDGHAGLARSIGLITDLVRDYGAALHPVSDQNDGDPFAVIAGLNGVGREGTLIQPLRLLPLVPSAAFGHLTLWDVQSGHAPDKVTQAITDAGDAAMRAHHADVVAALAAVRECDEVLTQLAGKNAPPFGQIIDVLDDTERLLRRLANLDANTLAVPAEANGPPATVKPRDEAAGDRLPSGPITSREQAFAELLRVAAYFRKAEPHSPISFSIETLVRRGRMDFMALLNELIPDESTRRTVMTTAGIHDLSREEDRDR